MHLRSVLALLAALAPHAAVAQAGVPVPDTLTWEFVARPSTWERFDVYGLGFCGDTLLVASGSVHVLRNGGPGYPADAGTWEELTRNGGGDVECARVAGRSILYIDRIGGLYRSLDGGYTAEPVLVGGQFLPISTPEGALLAYFDSPGRIICRTVDGEAWDCHDYVDGDTGFPRAFAVPRTGGPLPLHRLLANGQGGPAYSDDDGRTWLPSNLMTSIQTFAGGLCVIDGGPLHGRALAIAQNATGRYHVYESFDGITWADVGLAPSTLEPGRSFVYVTAIPGGLVAAYGSGTHVWLSGDGGRTWSAVFDVDGPDIDIDYLNDVEAGPDGYLYASVDSQQSQWETERGGVYRTTVPVFVVAGEAAPDADRSLALSVRPNPAGSLAEVTVSLAAPAQLRLVVVDVLGREVAVLSDGPVPAGPHTARVDTSAWPAGVYVVRATATDGGGAARRATARLTVVR